mgnify:CR=1 FL=1
MSGDSPLVCCTKECLRSYRRELNDLRDRYKETPYGSQAMFILSNCMRVSTTSTRPTPEGPVPVLNAVFHLPGGENIRICRLAVQKMLKVGKSRLTSIGLASVRGELGLSPERRGGRREASVAYSREHIAITKRIVLHLASPPHYKVGSTKLYVDVTTADDLRDLVNDRLARDGHDTEWSRSAFQRFMNKELPEVYIGQLKVDVCDTCTGFRELLRDAAPDSVSAIIELRDAHQHEAYARIEAWQTMNSTCVKFPGGWPRLWRVTSAKCRHQLTRCS